MHCMIQRNKEYWRAREVYDTVGKPLLWHSASKAVSSPGRLWMESSELLITGHKAIPPFRHSTIFYGIQYIPYCSCQVNLWLVRVSKTANLPSRPSPLASFLLFFARILRILHGVQACQSTGVTALIQLLHTLAVPEFMECFDVSEKERSSSRVADLKAPNVTESQWHSTTHINSSHSPGHCTQQATLNERSPAFFKQAKEHMRSTLSILWDTSTCSL